MADCNICCEKLRKPVACNYCDFVACTTCTRRYMLESESDFHCMNCKKQWSRDFIDSAFPKSFRTKELKNRREEMLMDREKSLLPATQHLVEREVHKRKWQNEVNKLYEQRRKLQDEIQKTNNAISHAYTQMHYGQRTKEEKKVEFIRKCTAEGCMGYLSTQWKCGICNLWSCPDCHEIKGETRDAEHTCIAENVESAKLITKETRPCPSCATRIFKIDGCDQMYCTNCQTPFSWKTGQKIISGTIHNPHYYEWMRANNGGTMPRNPGDDPCGGLPNTHSLSELVINKLQLPRRHETTVLIFQMHRSITHIRHGEMYRYEYTEPTNQSNSDLRILYMLKEIDEDVFKKTLQKREKKMNKNMEIRQVLQMFIDTGTDVFRDLTTMQTHEKLETCMETLQNLRVYVNSSLEKIGKRYSCVVPFIEKDWLVL